MTRHLTLLSAAGLGTVVLAATLVRGADMQPVHVTNLTGGLRVQQGVPCASDVDLTTPVTGGRIELTPADGLATAGGGKYFVMTQANMTFDGFSVTRSCAGFSETRTYGVIRVQIARTVSFTATPTGTPGEYAFAVPKAQFVVYYATTQNGSPDTGTKNPIEDVTGTINFTARTMTMRVVMGTRITFKAGCVDYVGCVINETKDGRQTADLAGTLVLPDADGDGVPDRTDNCRLVPNADQTPVATPTIAAPADVTLPSCLSRNFGSPAATDVCDAAPLLISNNAPAVLSSGANAITWTAQDFRNRTASATQTVTVVDTTAPVFTSVPPNVSMNDCGPANLGQPVATDDCAGAPVLTNNAPPIFYVGTTPVTWTATDGAGNQSSATQSVTVVDTTPPVLTCVATNPTGSSFRVSAIDACLGNVTIRFGGYTLAEGEVFMINETGQPGVRLQNSVSNDGVRHFQVGKGEAVISATDASGNVASVSCPVR
jgi:hypothetical protein